MYLFSPFQPLVKVSIVNAVSIVDAVFVINDICVVDSVAVVRHVSTVEVAAQESGIVGRRGR